MTKAELIAALAGVPDDTPVYVDDATGVFHSAVHIDAEPNDIDGALMVIISYTVADADDAA